MSLTAGEPRNDPETMPYPASYSLKFAIGGNADPDTYTDLDKARDVAFGVAEELGLDVHITEHYREAENVIEIIEG